MCISERLKYALQLKNVNKIKEFSELSGLPYRTAQSYLNGDREPNIAGLTKLCTQMGINLNWLLTGDGDVFMPQDGESASALTEEKQALMDAFDGMSADDKKTLLRVGESLSQPKPNKFAS